MSGSGGHEAGNGMLGGRVWLVILPIALAAGGFGTFLLLRGGGESHPPMVDVTPSVEETQREPEPPLPSRGESDRTLREVFAAVSGNATWAEWLRLDDLANRWVALVDEVSRGEVPRSQLSFLAPKGQFTVSERNGKLVMNPRSASRYDIVANVIGSMDAHAFASAYSKVRSLLDASYRAFGYPDGKLDPVLEKAISRVLAVPVLESSPQLVSRGALYEYADPKLEALSPAEKQLLRMGPRNLGIIQEKAREISAALNLSASAR